MLERNYFVRKDQYYDDEEIFLKVMLFETLKLSTVFF